MIIPFTIDEATSSTKPSSKEFGASGDYIALPSATAKFDLRIVCARHAVVETVRAGFQFKVPDAWGRLTQLVPINASTSDKLAGELIVTPFALTLNDSRIPPTKTTADRRTLAAAGVATKEYKGIVNGLQRKQIAIKNFGAGVVTLSNDGDVGWYLAANESWTFEMDGNVTVDLASGATADIYCWQTFYK